MEIKGIKLIRHNAGGVNIPDDPSYPYRLDITLRPPEFMEFAFIGLYGGSEVICVRGMTEEALREFIRVNDLETHPRLLRLEITQPEVINRPQ